MRTLKFSMIATVATAVIATPMVAIAQQNSVLQWHAHAQTLLSEFTGRGSAAQAYTLSLIQVAVYDATVAVRARDRKNKPRYAPFIAKVVAPAGADLRAAIATAAFRVGEARVNSNDKARAQYRATYDGYIAAIPDGRSKTQGIEVGEATARAVLAARGADNFYGTAADANPPAAVGVWQSVTLATPYATAGANDIAMANTIPLTAASPDTRRIKAAPRLASPEYGRDFEETKAYGALASTVRTAKMTATVQFWSEAGFSLWTRNVRDIIAAKALDEYETARALAVFSVATGDAMLACWHSKYAHRFWRPWQAIRHAGDGGNSKLNPDPSWTPLVRANHPEYPAGHGCFAGSGVKALELLFGDFAVTLTSAGNLVAGHPVVATASYRSLAEINADNANARVWGGLHWRTTMERSSKWSAQVAQNAVCGQFGLKCDKGKLSHDDY